MENRNSEELIKELLTLVIKGNNLVVDGLFPGSLSDNVHNYLEECSKIHKELLSEEEKEEDGIAKSE